MGLGRVWVSEDRGLGQRSGGSQRIVICVWVGRSGSQRAWMVHQSLFNRVLGDVVDETVFFFYFLQIG